MKLFFYDLTNFPFWFDARCLFRNNHNNNKKKPQSNKTILPEGRCIVVCDLLVSFQCLIARGRPSLVNESS